MKKDAWFFVAITFAWSWLLWLPQVLDSAGRLDLPGALSFTLGTLAVFGPGAAAFILVGRREGRQGARELWKRGWCCRFEKRWLIPIVLLPVVTVAATILMLPVMGETIQWEHGAPLAMAGPVFIIIYLLNALPEEYGWRGYLLERLQERWHALAASLAVGVIWGLWHLPLHFIAGTVQEVIPIWQFVLQSVVLAVLYTWLYNNTRRSILAVALFHAVGNLTGALAPYWITDAGRFVHFGLLLLAAAAVVWIWGPKRLVRGASATVSKHA